MKQTGIIMALAVFVVGCVSVSTPMRHPDGRTVNCSASGAGYIGAPAALIMRQSCIDDMRAQGFVPFDEPLTSSATTAKPTNTMGWKPLPGWEIRTSSNPDEILYAANMTYESYLSVQPLNRTGITNIAALVETRKARMSDALNNASQTATEEIVIKGKKSYTFSIEGTSKKNEAFKFHFHYFYVERQNDLLMIDIFAHPKVFKDSIEPQLNDILESLPI